MFGVKSPGGNCPGGSFMGVTCLGGNYPEGKSCPEGLVVQGEYAGVIF